MKNTITITINDHEADGHSSGIQDAQWIAFRLGELLKRNWKIKHRSVTWAIQETRESIEERVKL